MNIKNIVKNFVSSFKTDSSFRGADPNSFLKYGSRRMPSTWSMAEISDKDFYTGYGFAVINKRANRSVVLGKKYLFTDAKESVIAEANEKGERVVHPYLDLIRNSTEFSERDFWYDISTYLDLEGVYYLMAVRTVTRSGAVGQIQRFSLINPYDIRPVVNSKGELGGYVEQKGSLYREIPKEMIIPIRLLNPFDSNKPYSLADAARDAQFTMKQANDFAREAIDGNLNSPGILSSSIELPEDQFDNFVERVKYHGRGEPLFGNGAGAVTWADMQTDLDKAALDKINSINRDALLAVSGLSKTGVGVEESGTGREVSRTQKDDFTENAVMPQVENIIDALNLDYRRCYSNDFKRTKQTIALDNPLETDRDAERADVEIRKEQFALMQSVLDAGYKYDVAAKFAKGDLSITDLGEVEKEPEDEPETPEDTPEEPADEPETPDSDDDPDGNPIMDNHYRGYPIPVLQYLTDFTDQVNSLTEQSSEIISSKDLNIREPVRINRIEIIDNRLVACIDKSTSITLGEVSDSADRPAILSKLNKRYKNQPVALKEKIQSVYEVIKNTAPNDSLEPRTRDLLKSVKSVENAIFDKYLDELSVSRVDRQKHTKNLALSFSVYYTTMFPIYAAHRARETSKELNVKTPAVLLTDKVTDSIQNFAKREAESHINTILMDIENAKARIHSPDVREALRRSFKKIQEHRAPAIVNNAASRIFNMSQYEADLQILTREELLDRAYKQMYSLTGEPCEICAHIINKTHKEPIPFINNFADKGSTIEVPGKRMSFDYEDICAGNVHPNCNCAYHLIIM